MKQIFTTLLVVLSLGAMAQTYNITFKVNMNEVSDPFTTPEVNGTFNGWCGGCAPMSDGDADGIWELTIPLEAGTYEYKFAADSWAIQEALSEGAACTVTAFGFTNRLLVVSGDAVLDPVCWGSCSTCEDLITYDVTFQVNMNDVAEPFTTPEVNGNFAGWCGGCYPLSDADGDGIWSTTIALEPGTYEYKFAYDSWAGSETLTPGDPCTLTTDVFTNRIITVSEDVVLDPVCWGSCDICAIVELSQMNLPVTFDEAGIDYGVIGFGGAEGSTIITDPTDASNTVVQVIKSAEAATWAGTTITNAAAEGFATAIPFDAENTSMSVRVWSPDAGIQVRLKVEDYLDPTHSVETEATVTVAGGWETLIFNFSNEAPGTAELNLDYYLNKASIFFNFGVEGAAVGEKTYYFDDVEFYPGGGTEIYNVTFAVNMNEVAEPFTTPEVNGTFNGWCGGCNPLADADGDGIWTATIPLAAGFYEYKYAADGWTIQESLTPGDPCTMTTDIFTNRTLTVESDMVLDPVCWGSCDNCTEEILYNVTFQVNMNEVAEPFTTPEVNGTFNGWCGGCNPLADADGDGIWTATIALAPGFYEYKFAADGWAIQESLTPGDPCTMTTDIFTNRTLTVESDMVIDPVCWGSCDNCPAPACTPVSPEGVYADAITSSSATVHWDAVIGADQYVGALWNLSSGVIRKFRTTSEATSYTLPAVLTPSTTYGVRIKTTCFDEGVFSPYSAWYYFTTSPLRLGNAINELSVYPNPSNGIVTVNALQFSEGAIITVTDLTGQMVYQNSLSDNTQVFDVSHLSNGLYIMTISDGAEKKIINFSIVK